MKAITRRTFMGLVAGVATSGAVVGAKVASNAVGKGKLSEDDWVQIRKTIIKTGKSGKGGFTDYAKERLEEMNKRTIHASEIKAEMIPQEEYNVIDDLVEEMNRHDAENPGCHFRYAIHVNYSGLGMLNTTGHLEKEEYEPSLNRGYRHVLWIPVNLPGVSRGVLVGTSMFMKADIALLSYCETEDGKEFPLHYYREVTTRCFNVDYTKSGEALMKDC